MAIKKEFANDNQVGFKKRLYSQNDVVWLQNLRILLKDHKMSIFSLKILL